MELRSHLDIFNKLGIVEKQNTHTHTQKMKFLGIQLDCFILVKITLAYTAILKRLLAVQVEAFPNV